MDLPNYTKDQTQRKVQNKSSKPKKSQSKCKAISRGASRLGHAKKNASIVFSKSKPESSGSGDVALEKQKRVNKSCQEQKRKSATEKCNRGAISTVSIQTFPIFSFLLLFLFHILNRQRDRGKFFLWVFTI